MTLAHKSLKNQFGETISNLFHGAVALGFGLLTLAAAAHVMVGLV